MTNLQIAKLYLATNATATATQIDTAVTSGTALTAINALSAAAFLEASYQAAFHRSVDADGTAAYLTKLTDGTLTKDGFAAILNAGAAIYPATGAFVALNTADKSTIVNKTTAETAADSLTVGAAAIQVATVTDVATTATVAVEAINNAEYTTALTEYNTAVTTAAASKASADAAALTAANSVALATASQTAATTAKTDADAVVTKAATLHTAAVATVSAADDITSATAVTNAAAAQTTAAGLVTTATAALATATTAAADAAATGTTFTLTTGTDNVFGTSKSDTITGTQSTFTANDVIVDSSSVDNDVLTITATDDITLTPTVVGIERVNFNLDAAATTTGTTFKIDAANISAGTLTAAVTKAATTVTGLSALNVKNGMVVATNLATAAVGTADNANITVNMTATTATTVSNIVNTVTAGNIADAVTINAAGNFTLTNSVADGAHTITGQGSVTVTDMNAVSATNNSLTVSAKGAITLTNTHDAGNITLSTTTGNVAVTTTNHAALAGLQNLSATTAAGNVTVTSAIQIDGTVTASATGNIANVSATDDGDIAITAADAAVAGVFTATGGIAITSMTANKALTMTYGQASTIATAGADVVKTITLASNNSAASAADATVTVTASLIAVDNINFTGSNNVTLAMSGADLVTAAADTTTTAAAAVIATDTSTAISRIEINAATGAAFDASKLAVDQIAFTFDQGSADAITVATGANIYNALDQTGLTLTAAAVAGNTVNLFVVDDNTAADVTANDLGNFTSTNIATVNLAISEIEVAVAAGAIGVGTANKMVVTGAGALTVGTSVTANQFDASASTGIMDIQLVNTIATTFKTGSANDIFRGDGTAAAYTIDGGAGVDTLLLGTTEDYTAVALSLTSIEKIDASASGAVFTGAQMTGKDYVVFGNLLADTFAVNATNTTGEVINLAGITGSLITVTLTGAAGGDTLTGSSTYSTVIIGAAGADTITGGAAADTITGGNDADAITITDTVHVSDTVVYTLLETGLSDKITGFTAGATNGDIINMAAFQFESGVDGTTNLNTVDATDELTTTTLVDVAATHSTLAIGSAVTVFSTDIGGTINFATATDAEIVAAVAAALIDTTANVLSGTATAAVTNGATATTSILAFTDGTNTTLIHYTESGADASFASELVVTATLIGVDAAALTHANFLA